MLGHESCTLMLIIPFALPFFVVYLVLKNCLKESLRQLDLNFTLHGYLGSVFNGKLPKSRTLMHFAKGSSTEQQRKTASSTESSSELKIPSRIQWLFWHIVQSFYQNGNSLRNEKGLSFISHFSEIAIHLVTLVGGFSDLIYSFGQDHPQSLDGQHSFKRSSRNLRL